MVQVEMIIDSVRRKSLSDEWVVILKAKGAERYLPIYVGPSQADIIKRLLVGTGPVEPVDLDLSSAGIDIIFSKVESVTINRSEANVFHAKLLLSYHDKSLEVDCPPAKALALGVRAEAPIFADEALLDKAAIEVPSPGTVI